MAVWDSFAAENKTMVMEQIVKNKRFSDALLILWAGGAALLSYSLVYALRKPYTAASFEGFDFFGTDYKVAVTTIQILGYVIAKFFGIKLISELKKERRFKFFVCSAVAAEAALVGFGLLAPPFNVAAMFLNGLSLGCMWRDIQLYRGTQGDGYVGQSVGGKHGVQFRCGQEFRLVCHERDARGTVLDACRDWGFCFASSRFYGVYVEASATAYGRGYCAA